MICFILMNLLMYAILQTIQPFMHVIKINFFIYRLDDSYLATKLFENNSMKLFQDKCHLLVLGFMYENVWAKIGKTKIWECKKQKILIVQIYRTLSFDEYIVTLCRKAGKK